MGRRVYVDVEMFRVRRRDGTGESMINFSNCISNSKYKIKQSLNDQSHKKYNCSLYRYIRYNGGWDNFVIERLERYASNNKTEALLRMDELRKQHNAKLTMTLLPILDYETEIPCHHGWHNIRDHIICYSCRCICTHDFNKYTCPACYITNE